MEPNRPRGREKNVSGSGSVNKRGDGLHTGPVGSSGGYSGRGSGAGGGRSSGGKRSGGGFSIIILILALLFGGGSGLTTILGGDDGGSVITNQGSSNTGSGSSHGGSSSGGNTHGGSSSGSSANGSGSSYDILGSLLGGGNGTSGGSGASYGGWGSSDNTGKLNTSVAKGARDKRTEIRGSQKDEVTIMVYMCGTDLESRSGMATSDLQEMAAATIGSNVNLLVYTGGCTAWKNNVISSRVNQVYQIKNGGLKCLIKDDGSDAMTSPRTLARFIKWCNKNFPANRRELIFWDHGGGSLSGYGYDEKNKNAGSMTLTGIKQALDNAGVTFDFIGFDACLMATMETALLLDDYADYMIASEETEPGVGWYYTNWLTELSEDTSKPTIEVGKRIIDDFVDVCARKCRGQATTLSIIDLAEAEKTVPAKLNAFAKSASNLIKEKQYKTISDARYKTREFAQSTRIDQVDLVHLARNMQTEEGEALAKALLSAVKYNRTASNMTNAYGISIYFPYQKISKVDSAVITYKQIGMDDEYSRCIQEFASMEVSGQAAAGGTASPLPSLFGNPTGSGSSSVTLDSAELISQLLGSMMGGEISGISGLDSSNFSFFTGKSLGDEEMAQYLADNQFDAAALATEQDDDTGRDIIHLEEEQWNLVQSLELNMFVDDGKGYIDLGLDNVYDFADNGDLIAETDGTWLAINGQPVAYYYEDTVDDGTNYTITGRVPAMLNGNRVNLILVFDNEHPYGCIAGARTDYVNGETEAVAKGMSALEKGDTLEFLCDYYTYDGEYQDSYYLGDAMKVTDDMEITNVELTGGKLSACYRFTDIYNNSYWSEILR